jgi:hypothetical protein
MEEWEEIEMIPYHRMDWRVVKWTIINTFNLCRRVVDPDTWDWFGTQEWFWHWTRPYFQAV